LPRNGYDPAPVQLDELRVVGGNEPVARCGLVSLSERRGTESLRCLYPTHHVSVDRAHHRVPVDLLERVVDGKHRNHCIGVLQSLDNPVHQSLLGERPGTVVDHDALGSNGVEAASDGILSGLAAGDECDAVAPEDLGCLGESFRRKSHHDGEAAGPDEDLDRPRDGRTSTEGA
jgi:hypothetical protein